MLPTFTQVGPWYKVGLGTLWNWNHEVSIENKLNITHRCNITPGLLIASRKPFEGTILFYTKLSLLVWYVGVVP